MSDEEQERERLAAARQDLSEFARSLSSRQASQSSRPHARPLPGRSAFTTLGLLMRLRASRRVLRLLLVLLAFALANAFLPGGGVNLGFVPQALWSAVGALTGR